MQFRPLVHLPFDLAAPATANAAFVPVPPCLMAGLGWGAWQVYRQAWVQAAASAGPRPLRLRVADLPRVCRN